MILNESVGRVEIVTEKSQFDLTVLKWIFSLLGSIGLISVLFWIKPFNPILTILFGFFYVLGLIFSIVERKKHGRHK